MVGDTRGIVAYGGYVPYWRLDRGAIAAVLGSGRGRGTRAVASYDEDSTSMAVEAGRLALRAAPAGVEPRTLLLATSTPAYLDKTNATAVHAALRLDQDVLAADAAGSARSAALAMDYGLCAPHPVLAVLSDVCTGMPGGADERDGGDGAAAILFGEGEAVIAERIGAASTTAEVLDRWRLPGERASHTWEERFGEAAYGSLVDRAAGAALTDGGVIATQLDHVVVTGLHPRAVRAAAKRWTAAAGGAACPDLTDDIGSAGAAHLGLALADVLDRAEPGQVVLLLQVADGAAASIYRVTPAIETYRERRGTTIADQIASGRDDLSYASFLTWRGFLDREAPRRPDPDGYYAPPAWRQDGWKYGFVGSRCTACSFVHLPPSRVCAGCGAVDELEPIEMHDRRATIATYTIDHLASSPSPPTIAAVIDFDGGGRYTCELTDVDPDRVEIGQRVELTFRKMITARSIHNYFWKARPVSGGGD